MFSEVYSPQWNSLVTQLIKNLPAMQEVPLDSWGGKIRWRRDRLPTPIFLGFPGGSDGKESACNTGDLGLIPALGRSPGGGYSCLENPHGQRSLAGYSPWGHTEPDTTERLSVHACLFRCSNCQIHPCCSCSSLLPQLCGFSTVCQG